MSEPLKEHEMGIIPFHVKPIPHNDPPPHMYELMKMDWLPAESIKRQMHKMIRSDLPKYIAMTALGLNFNPDGKAMITQSKEFYGYSSGYFNPHTNKTAINAVKEHFEKFKGKKYKEYRFSWANK